VGELEKASVNISAITEELENKFGKFAKIVL
jgi:hypothetical protein